MPCQPQPDTTTLKIVLNAQGEIEVQHTDGTPADRVTLCVGDQLKFEPDGGLKNAAVQFVREGSPNSGNRADPPFNPGRIYGRQMGHTNVTVTGQANANDRWDYVVAVVGSDGNIYTVDPDIVIGTRG